MFKYLRSLLRPDKSSRALLRLQAEIRELRKENKRLQERLLAYRRDVRGIKDAVDRLDRAWLYE